MRNLILAFLLFASLGAGHVFGQIQANPWQFVSEQSISANPAKRRITPREYQTARLDMAALQALLAQAPMWMTPEAESKDVVLALPMPDGTVERFRMEEAPVMHPALGQKYPYIRAYAGIGLDDPSAYLRCDVTQFGFHGMVLSGRRGDVFIDPYSTEDLENYVVYFKKDFKKDVEWVCETLPADGGEERGGGQREGNTQMRAGDCILRTFSLALACTGEYANFHGATGTNKAPAIAAMNTSMVRVNGVYEKELSVHMDLVANNDTLVFTNGASDPYSNGNGSAMLTENQTTCNARIGNANYDIGHVFSTGGGGVAYLGCVCNSGNKAGGVTGQANPVGDPFDIDYVAHEMGHQFGANHTQNNNCNRNGPTAMEPGSASTIMGYAGICAPNVQNNSDAYFHAISLQEIAAEIASAGGGNSCSTNTDINDAPTANAGADYVIPKSTPFVLTGIGTDPNPADVAGLTYNWEQMDNAVATMPPVATNTGGPAFRSLTATTSPQRYFPNLPAIIANQTPTWEVLPSVARTLNFRVTVRDNRVGGGCTAEDNMVVTVNGTAGPFLVTAPNVAGINWPALSTQTVTWDVAGTNLAPISCANVDILLSTDGGNTYPVTILANTPNDGSQVITVPNNLSTTARIMVRSVGNVFFDISNVNFTISQQVNDFTFDVTPNSQSLCSPTSAVYTVNIGATGTFNGNVTLAATGIPSGATVSFSTNPVAAPGSSTMTINGLGSVAAGSYNINVTGTGSTGAKNETVGLNITTGAPGAPALTAPANGATGVSSQPAFAWSAVAGSDSYNLQVSTSNTFATLVINQSGITGTSFTPTTALASNTTYFWRANGQNTCGTGAWSSTNSFTTAAIACTTFASTDVPKTISAIGTPTITSVLPITVYGSITDVNLENLNITHSYIDDLIVKIKNPAGTVERTVLNRPCTNQDNILINFDDEATSAYDSWTCPPTNNGFYQPFQTLNSFDNGEINGTWTLTVQDVADVDGGTLNAWSLNVCYLATPPIGISVSGTNVSCNGGSNGSATATASGGSGTYSYAWSNGGTTATITNLAPGTYTVTVTSGPQTITGSVTITQPAALLLDVTGTDDSGNSDGTATATVSGGVPNYAYLWSNGGTTATITGLPAGIYHVTVTDANSCTQVGHIVIETNVPPLNASASGTNVSCNGGSNGTASVTASGGTGTYSYAWSNGGTTATISGLAAGTYSVTVTSGAQTVNASVTITQPTALTATVSGVNPACNGAATGSATATPAGGTAGYSYAWSNGATAATATGLVAGTYTVTVTDANGCTKTGSATLTQPTGMTLAFTTVKPSCFGGSNGTARVTPTGGVGTKTYLWSTGATTQTATGLAAGTYTVTVTDAAGCTKTGNATVTQPTDIAITFTLTLPTCFGASTGSVKATATGGTGTKTYLWSTGATTQTITGLPAGVYTVTATDTKGCSKTATATLNNPPQLLITGVTITSTPPTYRTVVAATGGTGTKSYRRSNGPGTFTAWQTSATFNGVPAGTGYIFEVRDAKLCTDDFVTDVPPPPAPANRPTELAVDFVKNAARVPAFELAPNPATQAVQIVLQEELPQNGLLEIADATGKILLRQSAETLAQSAGRVSLAGIPAGIVFVTLRGEGLAPVTRRLIVQ